MASRRFTLNQLYTLLIINNVNKAYPYQLRKLFEQIGLKITMAGSADVFNQLYAKGFLKKIGHKVDTGDKRNSIRQYYEITDAGKFAAFSELKRLINVKRKMKNETA